MIGKLGRINVVTVLIVTFFYLSGYAGAYQYEACPDSAQVNNAWWNPGMCTGGIYERGSLYFKWANAPFTNEIIEVESVTLSLITKSKGTDMGIFVWNGHSWSSLYGGRVDFLGDYVYDITRFPGPYMDSSHRIKIVNRGFEELEIHHIKLNVEYGSRLRELSVLVRDCQTSQKVMDAEVTVDSETKETGSDGKADFALTKEKVYEIKVSGEDYYEETRRVFLDSDKDVEVCVVKRHIFDVDVRYLDVDHGEIFFVLENTGNTEATVQYHVKLNDELITQSYVVLDEGEDQEVSSYYHFPPGVHTVTVTADANGNSDSETETHCVAGETENYRCSGSNVLRQVIRSGCVSRWELVEECEEGCSAGMCIYDVDGYAGFPASSCDFEIVAVNYADNIVENDVETMGVKVKNKGPGKRDVEIKLYIDDRFEDEHEVTIGADKSKTVNFRFSMRRGTRDVKVEAVACGKVRDTVTEVIQVRPPGRSPGEPSLPDVPLAEPVENGHASVFIELTPDELNAKPRVGVSLMVTVHSQVENEFHVEVAGIPPDKLDYPESVSVYGATDFYVYILSPEKEGTYPIKVKLWKESNVYGEADIDLVVSKDALGQGQGPVTGFVLLGEQSQWAVFVVIGIVIVAAFIVLFMRFFFPEQEYNFQNLEYDQTIRQAAVEPAAEQQ